MKVPSAGGGRGAPHPLGVGKTQAPGGPQGYLKILFRANRLWQRGWNWSWDRGTLIFMVFRQFSSNNYQKVEGINLQDEEFDPGGPLFWRKKKKSQKGVPSEGVTPPYFFGINWILEKKSKKTILNLHM